MGKIIIHNTDGTQLYLPSRDYYAVISRAEQSCALMGEDVLNISIESAKILNFQIGSYIDVFGKTYTLNQLPSVRKGSLSNFSYSLTFEGEQYELMDCAWLLPDTTTYGDSLTGNLQTFVNVMINENISRSRSDWSAGVVPETEVKTLNFSSQNCLQVLQNLCSEFGVEFEIARENERRILNFKTKVGDDFFKAFQYGRTGGAFSIERKTNTNQNVVTKLYAFGSGSNLGIGYKYSRLCLPNCVSKNDSFITSEQAQSIFGKRENVKIFEKIKPERKGKVTTKVDWQTFRDSSMDFDLTEKDSSGNTKWLIAGNSAKITFVSGNLAGYSFEILAYNHSLREFKLAQFSDENGMQFPSQTSEAFQFDVDSDYIIEDIRVPQSYIIDAENKLKEEAQKYFDEYCNPHVDYNISLNSIFIENLYGISNKTEGVINVFKVGDNVTIIDSDLGISAEDGKVRVVKFVRNLLDVYSYNLTLSNNVQVTNLQRVIGELTNVQQVIQMNNLADSARAKRNWKTSQEVLDSVFDAEGDYYTEKIKPNSIETQMLAVGAKPQQFVLKGALIQANYAGNPNSIKVEAGELEHYTINPNEVEHFWIDSTEVSDLNPDSTYYIYAKCERDGEDKRGTIVFSTEQIKVDGDPNYYHFVCGVLSSVMADSESDPIQNPNSSRQVSLTYGSTTINGRYLNTGRIQSADGNTYFDLDKGEIGGNIDFQDSVITETILIKNGKNADGQTQYCGAISGNTNYPVMWVSDQSTTDADAVKDLANSDCPVRITKSGIGSNIGCLNVASKNNAVIEGNNGNVILSSDTIATENAKLSPETIADLLPPHWLVYVLSLKFVREKPQTISNEYLNIVKLYDLPTSHNISVSSVTNGSFGLVGEYTIGKDTMGSLPKVTITRVLQTYKSATNNGKDWVLIDTQSIKVEKFGGSGEITKLREYPLNFMHSGAKLFLMQKVTTTITTSRSKTEPMPVISATAEGDSVYYPKFHFTDILQSNIMAIGGYTCSLDSDNYFKLYPSSGNLQLNMRCTYAMQRISLSVSASGNQSYIDGYRFGPLVFIKFKILRQHLGSSALILPTWARPSFECDGNTWGNYNFTVKVDGNITSSDVPSGGTLWGTVTYITTAKH